MFDTVLVPLDGSALSEEILLVATRFLDDRPSARLLLLHVIEDVAGDPADDRDARIEEARRLLDGVERRLQPARYEVEAHVRTGDPASRIVDLARSLPVGLVAMATHGQGGLGTWIRGSVAERVLRSCPVPLLLANPRAIGDDGPFSQLLVPLDGSARAGRVLPLVEDLARRFHAPIRLLHVLEPPVPDDGIDEFDDASALHPVHDRLRAADVPVDSVVRRGSPAGEILEEASAQPGVLLVMASHGRRGLARWVFGSVAEKVLRASACPILLLRAAGDPGQGGSA